MKAQDEMVLGGKCSLFCFVQIYPLCFQLSNRVESREYRISANDQLCDSGIFLGLPEFTDMLNDGSGPDGVSFWFTGSVSGCI